MADSKAIAVVGMACRFPGAPDEQSFWDNIQKDVCSIAPMPDSRFNRTRYFDPEMGAYGKSYCDLGGLVDEHPFDARAFRMPPKVVENTDVAHLWALEVARAALTDAGYDPFELTGKNVGVVVGHARGSERTGDIAFGTAVEEMVQALGDAPTLAALGLDQLAALKDEIVRRVHQRYPNRTEDGAIGSMTSALAGLIANSFGLTGRHMVVDAACASSFAALDIGVQALLQNRLDAAIVGGASYSQELSVIMFAQSRALSPDGSFPFDKRANGFISSDGFGLFVLRRLSDALRDGNRIRAVIRGVGGSCDGKGKALWAPRREGQVLAMQRAYTMSGVDPATVGMIEGHATSTPLGDRTELESVHEVYAEARGGRPMPVGSVKGNIGHCREAAGAAGLVKAILALEHQTLPPTGNFRDASPEIPWNELAVDVLTAPRPFDTDGVRRAGVNAFGIGGLNYHVLVEEAPPERRTISTAPSWTVTSEPAAPCDIAIVGVGGRFPGANDPDTFFERITRADDLLMDVPKERWDSTIYYEPGDRAPYRTYTKKGAFVTDFEADWRRYRVPPKLIERNDPLQFMILESALDALDDAKIDTSKIDRERVSVTVGTVFGSDYALALALAIRSLELAETTVEAFGRPGDQALIEEVLIALRKRYPSINEDSSGSFSSSTLASRTSKVLDFMGPTYAVDAACASSLASMEAATELLRSGVVDLAIYGGGDRAMRVQRYEAYCQFYSLSKSSTPRPFDHRADGFIPGEGAGVCVLKRLEDAQRDGDPIRAIIRGVGSSSDGEKKSLYKPSPNGLERAMRRALAQTDVAADRVGYIECHGGATPMGDQTEVEAVRRVYVEGVERSSPLALGSVKSNVGHTQGAAGVIAMIKAALTVGRGVIPPTRGFETPHPDHGFGDDLTVNNTAIQLSSDAAAVSSMGLAGINYHAVITGSGDTGSGGGRVQESKNVFTVGAANAAALAERIGRIDVPALRTAVHDGDGVAMLAMAATDEADLVRVVAAVQKAGLSPAARDFREKQGAFFVDGGRGEAPTIAFMFSGQGSQYAGMMGPFLKDVPAAATILDRVDAWLDTNRRARLSPVIRDGAPVPFEIFAVQALVLTADVMAYEAVRSTGITPDFVTGHSFGDYAALVAAEAWTLEDALEATAMRARAIERSVVEGGMMSVTAPLADVQKIIDTIDGVEAANVNAPDQIVVAGTLAGLDLAASAFEAASIEAKRLDVPGPFHSTHMGAAREALAEGLQKIPLGEPKIPYVSSVTQAIETNPEQIRAALVDQLVRPVRFVEQIELLIRQGVDAFIECGPRAVLTGLTKRIADGRACAVSVDDKNRAGAWSLARVEAMVTALSRAEVMTESDRNSASQLALLFGDDADRFLTEDGFADFWEKTRPSLVAFLESMWSTEKRYSSLPASTTATLAPTPIAESEEDTAVPTAVVDAGDLPSRTEVEAFLLAAICEQSGYPPDIIELDADLEADLGIDTVKQAQVLGKVRDKFDLRADEKLSLRDFPTLGHVLNYVDGQIETLRNAPQPAKKDRVAVPMVDLSKRRTERPAPAPTEPAVEPAPQPAPVSTPAVPSSPAPTTADLDVQTKSALPPPVTFVGKSIPTLTKPAFVDLAKPAILTPEEAASFELPKPTAVTPDNAVRPVTVLHLEGTAHQIGRQHGEAMRDPILEVLDRYQTFLGNNGMAMLALPETTKRLYSLFDQPSIEELSGVAEAIGIPPLVLLAYNLDAALFPSLTTGCTQGLRLAKNNDGALIHIVNEDSPLLLHLDGVHPRVVQIRRRTDGPLPNRKTVFFSLAGQIAGPNGVADSGLTVTSTTLLDGPEPNLIPTGLPHPMITKQILESATSIDEAVTIIEDANRAGRWSVLLSDADTDRAFYIEYDDADLICREEVQGDRSTTNHSLHGPAAGGETPEHSHHRACRAQQLLDNTRPLTVERAQAILRDRHDLGRGRDVAHATMNTIRRVDNVMSVVVEPKRRRVHVTDRVVPPGAPGDEDVRFITIDYGTPSQPPVRAPRIESVSAMQSDGVGIVDVSEVMRRQIVRAIEAPHAAITRKFVATAALIVGRGAHVEAIVATLRSRGAKIHLADDPAAAEAVLERIGPANIDTVGIVLPVETKPPWAIDEAAWAARRAASLTGPFRLLRSWAPARTNGTLFGVTFLGGALGFENAAQGTGDGGGLLGLLKAVRREFDGLRVQALDASASEAPSLVAEALFNELDGAGTRLEVGLLRGKRMQLVMAERRATTDPTQAQLPEAWIVTGGARGVTARMAIRLAELYQPRLSLLGRHELPDDATLAVWRALDPTGLERVKKDLLEDMRGAPGFSPLDWKSRCESIDKSIEIDATLRLIAERGAVVEYIAVDVADRTALDSALQHARAEGPIAGLLHGAGVEVAKPYDKKSDDLFNATVGGKVDGLVNLLALTGADPISHVVGFTSVSGRFGGHGQTDYSLANDAEARILSAYRARHPSVAVTGIAWAAFSEVGLAARSSARTFLEKSGQAFMTPAEGANHLVRELWAGLPEAEIAVCERLDALDLDRLLVTETDRPAWNDLAAASARRPMIDALLVHDGRDTIVERTMHADEPFLDQHRMGAMPILPAVMSLELMSELSALDGGLWSLADVRIERPMKIEEGRTLLVRAERREDQLRVVSTARKQDGVVLEPDRPFVSGRRVPAEHPMAPTSSTGRDGELIVYPYPKSIDRTPGSRMIFHGPVFRCLEGVRAGEDGGVAHLIVPSATSLVPSSNAAHWCVPAALLDGCLQAVGMLGRILYGAVALPAGFDRVDVSRRALSATGERVDLDVTFVAHDDDSLVANFTVTAADGPILSVRGYRAQVVPTT